MFDRRMEDGLLDALAELNLGSIVFSPLAQGLLTARYLDGIPADSRAAEGRWISGDNIDETYLSRARALNTIAEARGQSLAQMALLWVLRHPQVTSALIGASSVRQLDNSLDALDAAPLTADEIAAIEPHAAHGTGTAQ
jgi:L-glyceraldehyde 3-phosphate reductase